MTPVDPTDWSNGLAREKASSTHYNRPGMQAIAYRLGTHSSFYQRLLARLQTQALPDTTQQPLQALTTRDRDDPAIALLDAWALMGDVLTFYQERIANEGYLRTATEDRSVLELSRTVGYHLSPGVAASAYLAFTVDDSPNAEPEVIIPIGTKVQSIPSQAGQVPQTFETTTQIQARSEWNILKPKLAETLELPTIDNETTELRLQGTNTRLQPGDVIVVVEDEKTKSPSDRWYCCLTLKTVEPNLQADYTKISWDQLAKFNPPKKFQVYAFRQQAYLFGYNALQWNELSTINKYNYSSKSQSAGTILSDGVKATLTKEEDFNKIVERSSILTVGNESKIAIEKASTGESGKFEIMLDSKFADNLPSGTSFTYSTPGDEWEDFAILGKQIDLDTTYNNILSDGWILLRQATQDSVQNVLCHIQTSSTIFQSKFGLSGKVTRIMLEIDPDLEDFERRQMSILLQSEPLELFKEKKIFAVIAGTTELTLDLLAPLTLYPSVGQLLVIGDGTHSEVNSVKIVDPKTSTLTLQNPLKRTYDDPTQLTIRANIALATHGETVEEVLGSGDGGQANQRFKLKKPPLTYISAATASGHQSTLKIYVNQVLWQEVRSLHEQNARSQCYIVQTNEQGETTIIFGNGVHGARLPSGQENVRAVYRSGIGSNGLVKAGSLILLQNAPLGIREVTNPLPTSGAADRESSSHSREIAPRTVLTLDRIVSLRDYENFSRSFAGVGKAQAVLLWTGDTRQVHITLADAAGSYDCQALCEVLRQAIATLGNPLQSVQVAPYVAKTFNLDASIRIDSRYLFPDVKLQVEQALRDAFAFQKRAFGQGISASEVVAVIQDVVGVIAVDLNCLDTGAGTSLNSFIPAATARWNPSAQPPELTITPAELLQLQTCILSQTQS